MIIIYMILLISVSATYDTKFDTLIEDNYINDINHHETLDMPHIYTSLGILREPAGIYIPYGGSLIIPFSYSVPIVIAPPQCNISATLDQVYLNMLKHIRSILSITQSNNNRMKRQLLMPIALGINTLLSLYNTYEEHNLHQTLKYLESNQITLRNKIRLINKTQILMVNKLNQVMVVIGDQAQMIMSMKDKIKCTTLYESVDIITLISLITLIPSEFLAAYNSAISGKITPELLSANAVQEIIHNHVGLRDTLYNTNPSLLYELGSVIVTHIDVDHRPTITGIIHLPKLLRTQPTPLYHFSTVNYINNTLNYHIILPKYMVCKDNYSCWEIQSDQCIKTTNKVVCLQGMMIDYNSCLLNLKSGNLNKCNVQISSDLEATIIIQTGSGIFVGGTLTALKTYVHDGSTLIPDKVLPPTNNPQLITHNIAKYMLFKDNIYSTFISGYNTNLTYDYTYIKDTNTFDNTTIPLEWTPLHIISLSDTWKDIPHYYWNIGTIIIIAIVALLIYITIRIYQYIHFTKEKQAHEEQDHMLTTTVPRRST